MSTINHDSILDVDEDTGDFIFTQSTSSTNLKGASGPSTQPKDAKKTTTRTHATNLRKRNKNNKNHTKYCQNNMESSLSDSELHYTYFDDDVFTFDNYEDDDYSDSDDENSLLEGSIRSKNRNNHNENDGVTGIIISNIDDDISLEEEEGNISGVPSISLETLNKYGKKVRNRKSADLKRALEANLSNDNAIHARAMFSYKATNPKELSINVGDIITVTDKSDLDWWSGYLPSGEQGIFPSNYCYLIKKEDTLSNIKKHNPISRCLCDFSEEEEEEEEGDKDKQREDIDEEVDDKKCCPKNNEIVLHKMFFYFLLCGVI